MGKISMPPGKPCKTTLPVSRPIASTSSPPGAVMPSCSTSLIWLLRPSNKWSQVRNSEVVDFKAYCFSQKVESPDFSDSLRTALHVQFATDIQDMLLDSVHTEHQVTGDLAIGCATHQKLQHLTLTHSERLYEGTRVRGKVKRFDCGWLACCL